MMRMAESAGNSMHAYHNWGDTSITETSGDRKWLAPFAQYEGQPIFYRSVEVVRMIPNSLAGGWCCEDFSQPRTPECRFRMPLNARAKGSVCMWENVTTQPMYGQAPQVSP